MVCLQQKFLLLLLGKSDDASEMRKILISSLWIFFLLLLCWEMTVCPENCVCFFEFASRCSTFWSHPNADIVYNIHARSVPFALHADCKLSATESCTHVHSLQLITFSNHSHVLLWGQHPSFNWMHVSYVHMAIRLHAHLHWPARVWLQRMWA